MTSTPSPAQLREQLAQLDALRASGALDETGHVEGRRRLLERLALAGEPEHVARVGARLWGVTAAIVAVLAVVGYAITGRPDAITGRDEPAAQAVAPGASAPSEAQVVEMVSRLAERLKDRPDDLEGWTMLARSYMALGRPADAVEAWRRVQKLKPDDPQVLTDLADAVAVAGNRTLEGEPAALIERALTLDPNHPKALALSGARAFDRGDFALAARQWERVAQLSPPESPMAQQAREGVEEARRLATQKASAPAPAGAPSAPQRGSDGMPAQTASAKATPAATISGTVELASVLRARASPEDTVFVFARAAEGPRMPLALLRRQVKDLPITFTLDDSMAMAPGATLSGAARVVVGARISKSGQAMPQAGDLEGLSAPVAPGASGLRITIDRAVP